MTNSNEPPVKALQTLYTSPLICALNTLKRQGVSGDRAAGHVLLLLDRVQGARFGLTSRWGLFGNALPVILPA